MWAGGETLREEEAVFYTFTLIIIGSIVLVYMAISHRRAVREMEHQERLAMIQQGLMPPPERDPVAFEAAVTTRQPTNSRAEGWRSGGVVLVGLGLALFLLISFTARDPQMGLGVGGAFAALGATLLFHSAQLSRYDSQRTRASMAPPPRAYQPPGNPTTPHPPDSQGGL